ncbi:MAG TPA: hypothetical protein VN922_14675, partial [Bacteroidia bacterium]|nr:hypothetical protein [Bacteroidia bacterium]
MRLSKFLVCFSAMVVLVACHNTASTNNNVNTVSVKKDTAHHLKDTVKHEAANPRINGQRVLSEMDDTVVIPGKIKYNLYTFHPCTLGEPFSADSALKKLYPGNYYKLLTDKDYRPSVFEAWSCKASARHRFHGWADDDSNGVVFPLPDSNETQIRDTLLFTYSSGQRNILISFATTDFETDFIGMGRFEGAFMGLALFTEENNKWNLKAFNPAIGYYGMFQHLPHMSLFEFSKGNMGCYIGNMEQGAGGPDYIDAFVFAVSGNTFKVVLEQGAVARGNRPRDCWDTYMAVDSTQLAKPFPDLKLTTKGDYLKSGFTDDDGEDTSATLPAIKSIIKHKDNFDFTITSHYTFAGNSYKFVSE